MKTASPKLPKRKQSSLVPASASHGKRDLPRLFAAAVATGANYKEAYALCSDEANDTTCEVQGCLWAEKYAVLIAQFRDAARQAAMHAHGIDAAWLVGEWKKLWLMPAGKLTKDNPLCQRYDTTVTEVMLDDGKIKRTTKTKVWLPTKGQALVEIGKLIGAYPRPADEDAPPPAGGDGDQIAEIFMRIVRPGSTIKRHQEKLAEGRTLEAATEVLK